MSIDWRFAAHFLNIRARGTSSLHEKVVRDEIFYLKAAAQTAPSSKPGHFIALLMLLVKTMQWR